MTTNIEKVDVLICGSGSAGLCAALWLSRYGINYKILEKRDGPLRMGQADGVQTRTVELFDAFNIAEDLLKDSYHVLELSFWVSNQAGGIKRSHFAADKETEISHQPHVILNQARLNDIIIGEINRTGVIPIEYGAEVRSVEVDEDTAGDPDAYCVCVKAETGGVERTIAAKYVLVGLPLSCVSRVVADVTRDVMVLTVSFGNLWASRCWVTRVMLSGESWTSIPGRTFQMSGRRQ
jgi:phenol 2-monooxygenase